MLCGKAWFEPRTLSTKAERYDHCATRPVANTFHWSCQVLSSLWDSAPELAGNQTAIQHVFLIVNSFKFKFLQLDFIIAIMMIRILTCQICSLG